MVSSTLCLCLNFDFPKFGAKSTVRFVYEAPKMKKHLFYIKTWLDLAEILCVCSLLPVLSYPNFKNSICS